MVCSATAWADSNPWGDKLGGWCGKPDVNGGKNVYYVVFSNVEGEDSLIIRKSPNAIGDLVSILNIMAKQ